MTDHTPTLTDYTFTCPACAWRAIAEERKSEIDRLIMLLNLATTELDVVRAERDTAVAEQHRLFHGMANAGKELDAANARIAELERLLGETQAALGVAQEKTWQYEETSQ